MTSKIDSKSLLASASKSKLPVLIPVAALAVVLLAPTKVQRVVTEFWPDASFSSWGRPQGAAPVLVRNELASRPVVVAPAPAPSLTASTGGAPQEGHAAVVGVLPVAMPLASAQSRPVPVGEERPAEGRLLAEIARRQTELERRERELETRSVQLATAETFAREQMGQLRQLREEIERLVQRESGAADADIEMLVGLYSNMKPPNAAAVIGRLAPERAALILQKLGDRLGGPILAAMEPDAALAITDRIAARRSAFRR